MNQEIMATVTSVSVSNKVKDCYLVTVTHEDPLLVCTFVTSENPGLNRTAIITIDMP